MKGQCTIDEKPTHLHLQGTRPRSRSVSVQRDVPQHFTSGYGPQQGGYGFANQHATQNMPPYYPGQGYFQPQPPAMVPAPLPSAMTSQGTKTSFQYPDVTSWFQYLDRHDDRNKDGIHFSPY